MQKAKLPSIISLLVLTMITAVMWVSFSVYRALTSTTPPSVSTDVSSPLTPSLDKTVINKIESALFFNDSSIPQLSLGSTPVPSIQPVPTPLVTPIPSSTPEATASALPTP